MSKKTVEILGQRKSITRKNLMKTIFILTKQEIIDHILNQYQIMGNHNKNKNNYTCFVCGKLRYNARTCHFQKHGYVAQVNVTIKPFIAITPKINILKGLDGR
jgi:hypothetical protein